MRVCSIVVQEYIHRRVPWDMRMAEDIGVENLVLPWVLRQRAWPSESLKSLPAQRQGEQVAEPVRRAWIA